MRIIAGDCKGRRLFTPATGGKAGIRPTSDRAREALFNILGPVVLNAFVLDLFAGTGALGLEALSRGAQRAVFVDNYPGALGLIRKNLELCGFTDKAGVLRKDIRKGLFFLKKCMPPKGFNLVFLDPPYGKQLNHGLILELADNRFVDTDAIVVAEDYYEESLPEQIGSMQLFDQRRYGDTSFRFYKLNITAVFEP